MIRLLAVDDLPRLLDHGERLWAEREVIRSRPFAHGTSYDRGPREERLRTEWSTPVTDVKWSRCWALVAGDHTVVGHCDLKGGAIASELHRATLGIGIEAAHRDRGHGRALCEAAIAWARDQQLAWIDLGVFGGNARARALYRKLGFIEVGTTKDRFRVDGESIDDISMTLAL